MLSAAHDSATKDENSKSSDNDKHVDEEEEDHQQVDVTSILEACASSLTVQDPLLAVENFSLHDSMSGLEIMDRKMDCCEIPAESMPLAAASTESSDNTRMMPPRPLPSGLDDIVHPLPWDDLTISDAAKIAIEMLTRLEALLSGASVAETVYTCLYAHSAVLGDMKSRLCSDGDELLTKRFEAMMISNSTNTESGVSSIVLAQYSVYATTLAAVDISELIRNIVVHADIYEEEDFSTSAFGIPCYTKGNDKETVDVITKAMVLTRTVHEADARVVRLILQYMLDLRTACTSMANLTPETVRKASEDTKMVVASGMKQLEELQSILGARESACPATDPILKRSFDPYLYRPLVGNTPMRKVSFHKPAQSIDILKRVLAEIDWAVCDMLLHGNSLGKIRRTLERISGASPPVNILSRSLLLLNLYFGEKLLGQYVCADLIAENVKQVTGMPHSVMNGKYVPVFLERLVKPTYDTLKMLALNRNRQSAYMEAVIFQDWVSLQQEAQTVDLTIFEENASSGIDSFAFFSHYVLAALARLMDHHVALSVELSLVRGHHDLAIAYWYRDYLLSSQLSTLSAMKCAKISFQRSDNHSGNHARKQRGKKKAGKGASKKSAPESSTEDMLDDSEYALISLKRDLCKGLFRFLAALNQARLLHPPSYEFTSLEIRFQQRFEAFASITTPPPLSYDDFQQGSDFSTVSQADLLAASAECFKASKTTVDELTSHPSHLSIRNEELKSLAKVCIGNSVYVMKLSQLVGTGGEAHAGGTLSFDRDTNKQFCIIKIS